MVLALLLVTGGCERKQTAQPVYDNAAAAYVPPPPPPPEPPPPTIDDIQLQITVAATQPTPPQQFFYDYDGRVYVVEPAKPEPLTRPPLLATGVSVKTATGAVFMFVDNATAPPKMTYDPATGLYTLTIDYRPRADGDLVGRPIADIAEFQTVSVNYTRVLAASGLTLTGVKRIVMLVNGQSALEVDDPPAVIEGSYDLSQEFRMASSRVTPIS